MIPLQYTLFSEFYSFLSYTAPPQRLVAFRVFKMLRIETKQTYFLKELRVRFFDFVLINIKSHFFHISCCNWLGVGLMLLNLSFLNADYLYILSYLFNIFGFKKLP